MKRALTKIQGLIIALTITIIIAGFAVVYLLWPKQIPLPETVPRKEWPGSLEEAARPYRGHTIRVLMPSDSWNAYVKLHIVPEFEKITGIKVDYETLGWGPLEEKLTAELSAGTGAYDIVMVGGIGGPEYARNGWVIDLEKFMKEHPELVDPAIELEEIADLVWKMNSFPGISGIYAIPIYVYTYFGVYRKSWFERAGLDPPSTYDAWLKAMDVFTKDVDGDGVPDQYALAMPFPSTTFGLFEALWNCMQVVGLNIYEDHLNNKYMPLIDSPLGREALYLFLTLAKDYSMPGIEKADFFEVNALYTGEKAAMQWNWVPLGIGVNIGKPEWKWLLDDTGWIPIPTRDGRVGGLVYVTGAGIASASRHKEAAWLFLQYLLTREKQLELTPYAGGAIRWDILENPPEELMEYLPFRNVTIQLYKDPRTAYPRIYMFDAQNEIITRILMRMLAGEITVEEAADMLQKELCDLFLKYGNIDKTEYDFAYKGWKDVQPIGLNKYIPIPDNYFDWTLKLARCRFKYEEVKRRAIEGWIP